MLSALYRRCPVAAGILLAAAAAWEGSTRRAVPWWAAALLCAAAAALAAGCRYAIIERDQALTVVRAAAAPAPGGPLPVSTLAAPAGEDAP